MLDQDFYHSTFIPQGQEYGNQKLIFNMHLLNLQSFERIYRSPSKETRKYRVVCYTKELFN